MFDSPFEGWCYLSLLCAEDSAQSFVHKLAVVLRTELCKSDCWTRACDSLLVNIFSRLRKLFTLRGSCKMLEIRMQAELNHEELFNFFLVWVYSWKPMKKYRRELCLEEIPTPFSGWKSVCTAQRRNFQSKHEFPTISLLISNLPPFFCSRCIRSRAAAVDAGYEIWTEDNEI